MIKWFLDRSDSSSPKWPYDILDDGLFLEGEFHIKRSGSTEQKIQFDSSELKKLNIDKEINPTLSNTWDSIKLVLRISQKNDNESIEDICNGLSDVDVLIVIHGSKSKIQKTLTNECTLPFTNMELELSRESIYGDLRVQAFFILNKDYEENDYTAYKKGSVLGYSDEIQITIDHSSNIFGGRISEKWEAFEGRSKNALYRFKFDEEYPTIIYNSRFSNFKNLLLAKTPEGNENTLMRDFLIRMFVSQIYYDLASRLNKNYQEYDGENVEFNTAKALGKIFGKSRLKDILDNFTPTEEFYIDDEIHAVFQSNMKIGPILEKALENKEIDNE